jgi:hypothetical protein
MYPSVAAVTAMATDVTPMEFDVSGPAEVQDVTI